MFKTKLGLERLEDRDAPSGLEPSDGGTGDTPPPTPPPDPSPPVVLGPTGG